MNLEELKELIRLFEESSLTALEIEEAGTRFRLKRDRFRENPAEPAQQGAAQQPHPGLPVSLQLKDGGPDFNRITEVKSPVVGIFYEAPEPGGKPFVQVGDMVKKDDVLCLIEVMKQVTEVTAPQDGQVADICLNNGSVVEFGQTLMKLC
jgi:acetyl-CoA carboxylase biotin carboxyl carrier protein